MATSEPRALAAKAATRVAGGHTIRSALPTKGAEPAMILSSSVIDRLSPFIFQLPAISGRRFDAAIGHPVFPSGNRGAKPAPERHGELWWSDDTQDQAQQSPVGAQRHV